MPIEFRCESCGRLLQVPEGLAGQEAECAACGHRQPIPDSPPPGARPVPPLPATCADRQILERVQAPGTALMLLGGLGAVVPLLQMLGAALRISFVPLATCGGRFPVAPFLAGGQLAASLPGVAISAVLLYGGWSMYRLEHRGWAKAAAILALIPCFTPCCLLGIPVGIWALLVLGEPPVQAAFRS